MANTRTALQTERLRLYRRVIAASAVIGAVYGALLAPEGFSPLISILVGIVNGALISACIGGIEIFVLRDGAPLRRLPFLAMLGLKTLAYGTIVSLFVLGAPHLDKLLPGVFRASPLDLHAQMVTIGFSLATTVIFVLILQAASLVGRRTFRDLVLGRYRRPRAERRFFLFVDVVGSTAIAERLGPLQAHRFLAAVFGALAEPVAACRGEVYQYVGDEVVITWTEAEGALEGRPLQCFFLMEAALRGEKREFAAQFAAEPGLRAALHLGEVIAGEIGASRRAIVFHGDVMNTAARLEGATRDLGVRFIASDEALRALGPQAGLSLRDLGALQLRGRKEPIRAHAVEQA